MKYLFVALMIIPMCLQAFQERNKVNLNDIFNEVDKRKISLVTRERYDSIDNLAKVIDEEKITGDIVECGVWRGGMSIYLAYAFPEKICWALDSFQGFESLNHCKYDPRGVLFERHIDGALSVAENEVRRTFAEFGLDETKGVHILPGWVNDTTDPSSCPISEIALLRIDVDAYSATLVCLENLYDKVTPGGYIIFDDSCLYETAAAIQEFEKRRGIEIIANLYNPSGNFVGKINGECGLYFRKPKL